MQLSWKRQMGVRTLASLMDCLILVSKRNLGRILIFGMMVILHLFTKINSIPEHIPIQNQITTMLKQEFSYIISVITQVKQCLLII